MHSNFHAYKVLPIDSLRKYEGNPRTHSAEQITQLRASIREWGFTNPVLVDETGTLIAGHGRLEAASAEGFTELPAIEIAGLTDMQKRALVIADNQLATNAGWDFDRLAAEIDALGEGGFDVMLTGFTQKQIEELIGSSADPAVADDQGIDYQEKYAVLVECDSEQNQKRTFDRLTEMGFTCKVLVN